MPCKKEKIDSSGNEKILVDTGGGSYVEGDVHVRGGDFVGRDKKTINGDKNLVISGNVSNSSIVMGDGNTVDFNAEPNTEEFLMLLIELKSLLSKSKTDSNVKESFEKDIDTVQSQVEKDSPNRAIIISKLKSVSEAISLVGKSIGDISKISLILQSAIEWAHKLF